MLPIQITSNPFALLMEPEAVVQAMEHSDRLNRLQRRICRPLDKQSPLPGETASASFDREVEAAPDVEPEPIITASTSAADLI
ncbi:MULTISPECIES: hypothetical protein [unclassified Methylibium]|jgi:hypothetical protein|uniref:hypothetical protein n=1 Tax=unclassified Methylibium TaxID=2633235 RepID=UPI0007008186|nr:hypothetical protein [Methylibium sp. Root1272]KQW76580.1 hypothetical protein ASC67_02705 [Methylibium sp. Root1272]